MVSAKLTLVLVVVLPAAYTIPVHAQSTGREGIFFLLNFLLKPFRHIYLISQSFASAALW